MTALSLSRLGPADAKARRRPPIEYNLLLTATLCLLAFGVVMVFSASSTTSLLGTERRQRLLPEAHPAVRRRRPAADARAVAARSAPGAAADARCSWLASFVLLFAVLVPGIGVSANGAQRWIGAGLFQIQPSEFAKLALVLYGAHLLAARPQDDPRDPRAGAVPVGGRARLPADGRRARPRARRSSSAWPPARCSSRPG